MSSRAARGLKGMLIFLNLPVADLEASKRFFANLDFSFDPRFTDDVAACLTISEQASVMLLTRERFADFAVKPIADGSTTEAIIAVSADSRQDVDAFANAALEAGGGAAREPLDLGFMYSRSFSDLDGHHWEVIWMSPEAAEAGPAEYAETA